MEPRKSHRLLRGFCHFGAVTMLGADPGTGKTVFMYRVAEAAAYGKKVYGPAGLRERQCAGGSER